MGCDQSTDAGARWRRTYASDFNTERPARRNLNNNTYILGTKFPTPQNLQSQDRTQQASDKSGSQTIAMTSFGGNGRNETGDKKKETYNNSSAVVNAQSDKMGSDGRQYSAFGLSDDEYKNLKIFTNEELSLHNTEQDCWMAIYGVVVDVTDFIPLHVGGASIVMGEAGRDATAAFKRTHKNITKAEEMIRAHKNIRIVGRLYNYEPVSSGYNTEDHHTSAAEEGSKRSKKSSKSSKKSKRRDSPTRNTDDD